MPLAMAAYRALNEVVKRSKGTSFREEKMIPLPLHAAFYVAY